MEYCIYLLTTGLGTCGASCHKWECPRASLYQKSVLQVLLFVMLPMDIFFAVLPRCASQCPFRLFKFNSQMHVMVYLVYTLKDFWGRPAHSLLSLAPWRIEWSDGGRGVGRWTEVDNGGRRCLHGDVHLFPSCSLSWPSSDLSVVPSGTSSGSVLILLDSGSSDSSPFCLFVGRDAEAEA